MGEITRFSNSKPSDNGSTPMRLRAYMVIGCSDNGFLFGVRRISIPEDTTNEKVFPSVVDTFFDNVEGLLWGVVMGPKSIAKA